MIRGYMKLRIVRNNTLNSTIICMSLTSSSVNYLYKKEFVERNWSDKHEIEIVVNDADVEIGGDLTIYSEYKNK